MHESGNALLNPFTEDGISLGAIDCKHVEIQPPPNSGSYYFNYKGTYSIVLMGVVNANYEFIYADVGANGRFSDGGVWENSSLSKLLETNDATYIAELEQETAFCFCL